MSPKLIIERGYSVVMYLNDHEPPHVHVKKAGKEARVQITPIQLMDNWGYNDREIKAVLDIVEKHQSMLLAAWYSFYSGDDNESK